MAPQLARYISLNSEFYWLWTALKDSRALLPGCERDLRLAPVMTATLARATSLMRHIILGIVLEGTDR